MTSNGDSRTSVNFLARFHAAVRRNPSEIAVAHGRRSLTYSDLSSEALRLASQLRQRGVGTDVVVGIALDTSVELAVSVLAVLEAGGAYVPVSPTHPQPWQRYVLDDAQARLAIAAGDHATLLAEWGFDVVKPFSELSADELLPAPSDDGLGYVLYDAKTEYPHGVAFERVGLTNLIDWQLSATPLGVPAKTIQYSAFETPEHFQEFFGTWCAGGTLCLTDRIDVNAPERLIDKIDTYSASRIFMPSPALQTLAEVAVEQDRLPSSLRSVVTDEQLQSSPAIRQFFTKISECRLHLHYRLSETQVIAANQLPANPDEWPNVPPVGHPIEGVQVAVLDEENREVENGQEGRLFVGGVQLARGFMNRPGPTREKFVVGNGGRWFDTGDRVVRRADGMLDLLGRGNRLVKYRGQRVELVDVESGLVKHPSIAEAFAAVRSNGGSDRLIAYVMLADGNQLDEAALRAHLAQSVPEFLVPSRFVAMDRLPRTATGSIDRSVLPDVGEGRPDLSVPYVPPATEDEIFLAALWADALEIEPIGALDDFFELGGDSLKAASILERVRRERGSAPLIGEFFRKPVLREVARTMSQPTSDESLVRVRDTETTHDTAIAVVGMSGRFPGAKSVDELWENLLAGVDSITKFSIDEIDPTVPPEVRNDPNYVRARGIIDNPADFDAKFFGWSPRIAEMTDPQQRIFLEICREALEHAGYAPELTDGSVGVFGGSHNNTYASKILASRPDLLAQHGEFETMILNEKDFVATRVAHALNLRGPALSIHTACSTSLVAVVEAWRALVDGRCDMALAGGIAISFPVATGHMYTEGSMMTPDGHTRPFDADGAGTMWCDGAGVVLLKRLADAQADGDFIHAVIVGAASNNDGADKASFTAPSIVGQSNVIAEAQSIGGIEPETIGYVEAHGTATPLGDPIEMESLTRAFRRGSPVENGSCLIGSVKGNLGHLTAAAGVAGLIKTVLALREKVVPPTPHFQRPNPALNIENTPFRVCSEVTRWVHRGKAPRRAGVSSFGVGGTNAHTVLEEAPQADSSDNPLRSDQVLVVSAKTKTALDQASQNLVSWLQANPDTNLADAAWTLQVGRTPWKHRRAVVASTAEQAIERLQGKVPAARKIDAEPTGLAFLFPGQGSQYPGMGLGLATTEPVFRDALDRCAEIAKPALGLDLRDILFATDDNAAEVLSRTEYAQPGAFAIEYAVAETWRSWGVESTMLAGHSIGEFVAATLAGVFTLEDALLLVCERGKLMQAMPTGSMLSVALDEKATLARLPDNLALACVNAPELCVIAGPTDAIEDFRVKAEAEAVSCKSLVVSHAFHSAMMDPAVEAFGKVVGDVPLAEPKIPIVSTATGELLSAAEATDPMYWTQHLRRTVRFAPAIETMLNRPEGPPVFLEIGPRNVLTSLVRLTASTSEKKFVAIASLADVDENNTEPQALMGAVASLWTAGVSVDWHRFHKGSRRHRIPLPTYPFERRTYMVTSGTNGASNIQPTHAAPEVVAPVTAAVVPSVEQPAPAPVAVASQVSRIDLISAMAAETLADVTGDNVADIDPSLTFLELGMDSLILTQAATALKKRFGVPITFRGMMEDYPDLTALSKKLDVEVAADFVLPTPEAPAPVAAAAPAPEAPVAPPIAPGMHMQPMQSMQPMQLPQQIQVPQDGSLQALIASQLNLMSLQLAIVTGQTPQVAVPSAPTATAPVVPPPAPTPAPSVAPKPVAKNGAAKSAVDGDKPKAFGAAARIRLESQDQSVFGEREKAGLAEIMRLYGDRTKKSKERTQAHRAHLADPRAVSGFRPELKEIVYPIVVGRSEGCRLLDVDGNEYVDITCGFGSNFLGNAVPEVKAAVARQLELGYEIGPQHPLAGEVAGMIAEMTGMERVAFCNTGSEAVLGAMRLARNATGRDTVVMFDGDYHGILDEVIVRKGRDGRSLPAAAGIPRSAVENIVILEYGADESLDEIRRLGDDVAAVLIEPVQSRRPGLQPKEFVHKIRGITKEIGAAMIMDEVITGFRVHPRGAQGLWDVQADIGTYGKVVGGGMPIGVIAGKAEFMDGLDGGHWQYGDDSAPTAGVTYFAGTFVRHPLALAAAKAVMELLKSKGPGFQEAANRRTDGFIARTNEFLQQAEVPIYLNNFGTLFKIHGTDELEWGELLYIALRSRGVHVWDHRPCFFTTAHTDADIEFVEKAFRAAVDDLIRYGLLPGKRMASADEPPMPGARRGRDPNGVPAWYISDPDRPGKYVKVGA